MALKESASSSISSILPERATRWSKLPPAKRRAALAMSCRGFVCRAVMIEQATTAVKSTVSAVKKKMPTKARHISERSVESESMATMPIISPLYWATTGTQTMNSLRV